MADVEEERALEAVQVLEAHCISAIGAAQPTEQQPPSSIFNKPWLLRIYSVTPHTRWPELLAKIEGGGGMDDL